MYNSKFKILFQLSGSIAAYKACQVLSYLVQEGHEIQVICTPSTFEFVGRSTLEGLSGRPVLSDLFSPGHAMDHIQWARWADIAVICPATANTINKLAAGIADDLIGSLFLAYEKNKPYLIFPAMNSKMLEHPATTNALKTLKSWGIQIKETSTGNLACGEYGSGKLLEPSQIIREIESQCFALRPSLGKILITSGGTQERIDNVRHIKNFSTGKTGAFLAKNLARRGWQITLLRAEDSASPEFPVQEYLYSSFSDLNTTLKNLVATNPYDAVIHLAAVSDYSVEEIVTENGEKVLNTGKINSLTPINLKLKLNFKILEKIKSYSLNKDILLIGFKLTDTRDMKDRLTQAAHQLARSADAVILNDKSEISESEHKFQLLTKDGKSISGSNKSDMAERISAYLNEKIDNPIINQPEISL